MDSESFLREKLVELYEKAKKVFKEDILYIDIDSWTEMATFYWYTNDNGNEVLMVCTPLQCLVITFDGNIPSVIVTPSVEIAGAEIPKRKHNITV